MNKQPPSQLLLKLRPWHLAYFISNVNKMSGRSVSVCTDTNASLCHLHIIILNDGKTVVEKDLKPIEF